jgi:DNA gyrase subunit A
MACRFYEQEVRAMGRAARGVTGIRFKLDGDCVVGMEVVPAEGTAPQMEELPEGAELPELPETEEPADEAEGADGEEIIEDTGKPQLLIVTSGGMGKRSYVEHYRLTRRGAKGVKNINLRDGETVVASVQISHGDEIIITTERGQVVRIPVDEIRIVGRNSKGVKIMNLRTGDKITGVARLKELEALPGEENKADNAEAPETAEAPAAETAVTEAMPEVPEEPAENEGSEPV